MNNTTKFKYWQVHGDHQTPDQNPQHYHDQRFDQAGKGVDGVIHLLFVDTGHFGQHIVQRAGFLANHDHLDHHFREHVGGTHRDVHLHGDVSADLGALASHPVITVCAGAKSFLDLPRTLEHLEMIGVPVIGLACDHFPAFTVHSSGLPIPARVDDVSELASVVTAHRDLGRSGGILTCVPVPLADSLDKAMIDAVIDGALRAARDAKIEGPKVTPFVLGAIAEATKGSSVVANLSLARNNARVAAELAVKLSR